MPRRGEPDAERQNPENPVIHSVYVGAEVKRMVVELSRIYGTSMSNVLRTLVEPHLSQGIMRARRAFEEHRERL